MFHKVKLTRYTRFIFNCERTMWGSLGISTCFFQDFKSVELHFGLFYIGLEYDNVKPLKLDFNHE